MRSSREDGEADSSENDDDPCMFWLPQENRDGFWWPGNTAVMARNVTKIDFSQFKHGESWHLCRTTED